MSRRKNQERKALKDAWRKLRGLPPSEPFHLEGGVPWYHSPSTHATDRAFDLLKRLFGSRRSDSSD